MRKVILLITFLIISPSLLIFSLVFYLFISYHDNANSYDALRTQQQARVYAALPLKNRISTDVITTEEGRVEMVRQFLAKYKSPLEPHARLIVETADKYRLDFRLIPAISMQESGACRRIPKDSHNCWGFGIYGGKITKFSNFPEAIETVTKTLATKYRKKGLVTPEEIMSMYTPSSPNGSWAKGVTHFMEQLQ